MAAPAARKFLQPGRLKEVALIDDEQSRLFVECFKQGIDV
jgi:hypothetical protein